jgi:sugar phosphate isomerase/epimerase
MIAKREFGISAVEYVNTFYFSKKNDQAYWKELKSRCDGEGVESLLIMCDAEGNLGDTDDTSRMMAVENHYGWIDQAKFMGCHSIRVNAAGTGTAEEVRTAAIDGLGRLTEYGKQVGINVIVENHGGYSSDAKWLTNVISQVGSEFCGTLPDFGNFCIEWSEGGCKNEYDRYLGIEELLPYAKGVSAKSNRFDENGNEVNTDFERMLKIVKNSGFTGYIGIEYEGTEISEREGIMATKNLLMNAGRNV